MAAPHDPAARRDARPALRLAAAVAALPGLVLAAGARGDDEDALGPPPAYEALVETRLEPAGRIDGGSLQIDRFEFELTGGDLYLLPRDDERVTVAVYLGDGVVRCYPPDGVEHQQVEKFLDEDFLEEEFDRFVFWLAGPAGRELRALAAGPPGRQAGRANDLLEDRREALLERRHENPDSRLLFDILAPASTIPAPRRPAYFYAQVDGDDEDWFSIEIEPLAREEVSVSRFRRRDRRNYRNTWLGFHALVEFGEDVAAQALRGFPRDPEVEGGLGNEDDDDDDWDARDLGLLPRTLVPDREGWTQRVAVPRIDVDLALEGDGDAQASAALLIEPLETLAALRIRISRVLEVTDVRWRTTVPARAGSVLEGRLLGAAQPGAEDSAPPAEPPEPPEPSEPAALTGERLHYVQETHGRLFGDDFYEPWVTIALPRAVAPGERFVLEIAYEGELVERLRSARGYLLKDTVHWIPMHLDNRRSLLHLTYRVPEGLEIASGMTRVDERVGDGTRIAEWVSDEPVRGMAFSLGRFDVTTVDEPGRLPITVYENRYETGFAPGNLEKTIEDLEGSIRFYTDYFGPYPYRVLNATEIVTYTGQAFPGLVLLSFQAFGPLNTGVAEHFRAHEVAHQWWGAAVHWEDYRDQWISEGFSNYAAALYVLAGLDDADQFQDILDAWRLDVLGEVNVGQGTGLVHFGARPEVIRRSDGHESGPVVAGYRLNSSETPVDYQLLVYEKGAFILHMLRMMLADLETGDDTRFRELMRRFVRDHRQQPASTRTFETAVTRAFGKPMDWFFDQWVYGVDVPTYRPDLRTTRLLDRPSPYVLHGTIRQEDVPDTFRMPVPIRVEFAGRAPEVYRVLVDAETVDVEIPLPAEPTDVDFNWRHAVLAHVR